MKKKSEATRPSNATLYSAGIAVYRNPVGADSIKLTVLAPDNEYDWDALKKGLLAQIDSDTEMEIHANHAVLVLHSKANVIYDWFIAQHPELHINSAGTSIEISKDKGLPANVLQRFEVEQFKGSHALGHSRMATESAVTIQHSHPFSSGQDLCLVHNGSLSNHNILREQLQMNRCIEQLGER